MFFLVFFMRLFIAIDLPKDQSSYLKRLQKDILLVGKVKPVHSFHLTLRFLGEIPSNNIIRNDRRTVIVTKYSSPIHGVKSI